MASRANHRFFEAFALLCAAAMLCAGATGAHASEGAPSSAPATTAPAAAPSFPVAMDARLAGDDKQTRFVLDLDKSIPFRAFTLADPYRVVVDLPQVNFHLAAGVGNAGRGLVKAFRYGLVMPGGSRIVFDLAGPAKISNSYVLDPDNGQPARLVLEFSQVDQATFDQSLQAASQPQLRPAIADAVSTASSAAATQNNDNNDAKPANTAPADRRPLIVIDPGHGGIDNGTQANGQSEKNLVLAFGLALRDRIEKGGKYRVVMTRSDDTFIPLDERVKIARDQSAALFVSIHADSLPRKEGDAQGATIYTLSDKASDAEAARLAETENRADAIGGVNLKEEPTEVADILIDLAQRETRTFSNRFAHLLANDMKSTTRMYKHPLKSAGFRVLKAPDVPSVLVELGYVSNKSDLDHLISENWRSKNVEAMTQAIDQFLAKRMATAGPAN
ncbi:MAG TPA: N-acetylmuramoyl-L-alanine amidase [Bradyrhizobium sp.]|nr:N-acetylmuramoyl-L-alanine amidase [Bradyrhizobium sp.]